MVTVSFGLSSHWTRQATTEVHCSQCGALMKFCTPGQEKAQFPACDSEKCRKQARAAREEARKLRLARRGVRA